MIKTHRWKDGYKTRGEHRTNRGEPGMLAQKNCSVSVGGIGRTVVSRG